MEGLPTQFSSDKQLKGKTITITNLDLEMRLFGILYDCGLLQARAWQMVRNR